MAVVLLSAAGPGQEEPHQADPDQAEPALGDPSTGGDSGGSDPAAGDPAAGDPPDGDPAAGDPPDGGIDVEGDATKEFAFPVDLTEDFYHRLRAGLFVPESEPLIMQLLNPADPDDPNSGETVPAPHRYMRFEWGRGTFDVRSDRSGLIVVHLDESAALSHLTAVVPSNLAAMTRDYPEHPRHPIR